MYTHTHTHIHIHILPFYCKVSGMLCHASLKHNPYAIHQCSPYCLTHKYYLQEMCHHSFGLEASQTMHLLDTPHCNSAQALPVPSPLQRSA